MRASQVNANEETCLALPCTCQQLGPDESRKREARPFLDPFSPSQFPLTWFLKKAPHVQQPLLILCPEHLISVYPGAPRAVVKGLNVQPGSVPYLISTWMKCLFASNSLSTESFCKHSWSTGKGDSIHRQNTPWVYTTTDVRWRQGDWRHPDGIRMGSCLLSPPDNPASRSSTHLNTCPQDTVWTVPAQQASPL